MLNDQLWIVRGTSQHNCNLESGVLSIKCMYNGGVLYETSEGRYWVDDSQYLILNHGQSYRMEKSSDVLSVCVFFPSSWASDILRASLLPDDMLLDDPFRQQDVLFFETLQHHGDAVSAYMQIIKNAPQNLPPKAGILYEEFLRGLLLAMLQSQRNIAQEAEKLPDARLSTRLELMRRLYIARDYLHASYAHQLTIDILASVANLSAYHFIRKFKALFGTTPHSYLQQLRLRKAQELLLSSQESITAICYAVGFQSLGSFSTLFHKHTGLSPRDFRKQAS